MIEASALSGVPVHALKEVISAGELEAVRRGKVVISHEALRRFEVERWELGKR